MRKRARPACGVIAYYPGVLIELVRCLTIEKLGQALPVGSGKVSRSAETGIRPKGAGLVFAPQSPTNRPTCRRTHCLLKSCVRIRLGHTFRILSEQVSRPI